MVSFLGLENKLFLFYPISSMLAFSCVAASCKRTAVGLLVGHLGYAPMGGPLSTKGRGRHQVGRGEALPPIIRGQKVPART